MELTSKERELFERERSDYATLLKAVRKPARRVAPLGLELICIGNTGGAASVTRGNPTGGFLLRYAGRTLIVDPGANSISNLVRRGFNPFEITDVLASHAHNDHVGDLSLAVSAAINLGVTHETDSRIIVSPSLIEYSNSDMTKFGFTLPAYAWRAQVEMLFFESRQATRFDGEAIQSLSATDIPGGIRVTATEARHAGTPATGYLIETGMGKIGYTGDTEYFDGLQGWFQGVDVLWMNMNTLSLDAMIPAHLPICDEPRPTHNHLGYVGACGLIDRVRPKMAVVTHFGAQLVDRRGEIQAALRARFAPLGVDVHCPENMHCLDFRGSLSQAPVPRYFPC